MKKNGFTIAEALIVLGIIGIISILTIPTFISGQRKNMYASFLNIAVSNFNTAMNSLILQEGVDNLLETKAWQDISEEELLAASSSETIREAFQNNLRSALKIVSTPQEDEDNQINYVTSSGDTYDLKIENTKPARFIAKNGVEYKILINNTISATPKISEASALENNIHYTQKAADVYIDINGESSPNIIGRDLFRYELGANGKLYPFGSRDYCFYNSITNDGSLPDENTVNTCMTKEETEDERRAAYLMNNGYKMDY